MPGSAGVTALFAAVGVTGLSAGTIALAVAAINIGISMAIGTIMQALTSEDVPSMDGQGMLANKASSIAPIKVIYGYRRVGATRVFVGSSGSLQNRRKAHRELHMVLAISEGEIESFEKIWINDVQYEVDGVINERFEVMHGNVPVVEFNEHLGAWDQVADEKLIERMPDQWSANHKLSGTAYLYVRLYHDTRVWYSGIPTFTFDVKGVKVKDPRTGVVAWSDNPALCIRDYLTNDVYGRGIDEVHIDDAAITVAADYCDEVVTKGTSDVAELQELAVVTVPESTVVATSTTHTVSIDSPTAGAGLVKQIIITASKSLYYTAFGALRLFHDGVELAMGDRTDVSLTEATFSSGVRIVASSTYTKNSYYGVGNVLDQSLSATYFSTDGYWLSAYSPATVTITFNTPVEIDSFSVVTKPDTTYHTNRGADLNVAFQGQELFDKRYTCNGVVDVDKKAMTILGDLLTSCRGIMVFSGGKYRLVIDKPTAVTGTATVDNITGSWNISLGDKSNTFNSVRARFFNQAETWQDDQIVVDSQELQKDADNNLVLQADLKLPFTSDAATAQQIALANLKQSRQQIYAEFTATIIGMVVEVGDVIHITHPTPGWNAKPFRILKMSLQPNDEILIGCREYEESVYDVSELNLHVDKKPDTNLSNLDTCLPPTDMVGNEEITYAPPSLDNIAPDDTLVTKATVTWETNEPFASYADLQYQDPESGEWVQLDDIESNTDKVSTS